MATGFERRGQGQSPFGEGVNLTQQVGLQGNVAVPGVARPAGMNVQPVDTTIMDGLAQWGGKAIQDQAAKQMNASLLDGQMAAAQGESFATVETGGDKWKIEGFHQMEAQTMSAQLLEAQKAEIQNSAYALSPDEYRAQFNTRIDAMLTGKDPRVQDLVRKQIAGQIPTLAGAQTGAYTNYAAQRTFEAGVQAVHAVSQDASGDAALAAIASPGADSPLAALGPNERREAVTQGVMFAFQNDNPGAYIKLKSAGAFNDFTPQQQAQIEAARKDYQGRLGQKFDAGRMAEFDTFYKQVEAGDLDPLEAAKQGETLYAKYGLEINNEEGWKLMTAARTGQGVNQQATMNNIETAIVSGDFNSAGQMAGKAVVANESGGNYNARGPVLPSGDRAYGKYQIMGANIPSWTKEVLGYSMTPEQFIADKGAQDQVFGARFGGYIRKGVAKGKSPAEAVRDAISMWHSGRGYDEAVAAGATDGYMSTKDYTDKAMLSLSGQQSNQINLSASEYNLQQANVAAYSAMVPERDNIDSQFIAGQMSETDWRTKRAAVMADYHVQRTANDVSQESNMVTNLQQAQMQAGAKSADNAAGVAVADAVAQAKGQMLAVVNNPDATLADKQAALGAFAQARDAAYVANGVEMTGAQRSSQHDFTQGIWDTAVEANRVNTEKDAAVARAAATGTLGSDTSLDPKRRDKWYQGVLKTAQSDIARIVAKDPKLTPQANSMVQSQVMDQLAKAGYVPEGMSSRYTAAIEGNLVDKNGNPTPEAIASVQDYMAMKIKNPRVADMMFQPGSKAGAVASQIAEMAGQDPNGVQSAISAFKNLPPIIAGMKSAQELEASPELQSEVKSQVWSMMLGRRTWLETLNPFDLGMPNLPNYTALQNEVTQIAGEKWARAGGVGDPTAHIKAAMSDVQARTTEINGTMVTAPKGININTETFGNVDMTGDQSAVDNAIRMFIKDHAGDDQYGIPANIATPWQDRSTEVNGIGSALALPFVGGAKYVTQAGAFLKTPFRSDAGAAGLFNFNIDMVPNTVTKRSDGTYVTVTLLDAENYGTMITVPLAEAGRAYSAWRQSNAVNP